MGDTGVSAPTRTYGTDVGEPPVFVDPRRWGAVVGIVGGLVFIFSYAPPLGAAISLGAEIVGIALALVAIIGYFVKPSSLGTFRTPGRAAPLVYVCCVAAELVAIGLGSRLLTGAGHADLRPALIAAVVGAHFIPFGWAFGERGFYPLGLALLALGGFGLVAGFAGVTHAADGAAVLSGLVMLALVAWRAVGRFVHRRR